MLFRSFGVRQPLECHHRFDDAGPGSAIASDYANRGNAAVAPAGKQGKQLALHGLIVGGGKDPAAKGNGRITSENNLTRLASHSGSLGLRQPKGIGARLFPFQRGFINVGAGNPRRRNANAGE